MRTRALPLQFTTAAVLALVALLGVFAQPAREAAACSLVPFGYELLPFAIESSTAIAVGRLVDAERNVITLDVEEGLKGAASGERLTINNSNLGLGPDCSVYEEPGGQGFALPEEARVIAFLQANELGGPAELRSALYGYGIFVLEGDVITRPNGSAASPGLPTLPEVRDAARQAGFGPDSPGSRPAPGAAVAGERPGQGTPAGNGNDRGILYAAVALAALAAGAGTLALVRARR